MAVNTVRTLIVKVILAATSDYLNKYLDSSSEDSGEEPSNPDQECVLSELTHTCIYRDIQMYWYYMYIHNPSGQKILNWYMYRGGSRGRFGGFGQTPLGS